VGQRGTILTSPDGATWKARSSGTTSNLNVIAYGNNQFVAVGDSGTFLISPDGATWTARSFGTSNNLSSVTYGNNQFIAVGIYGTILALKADGIGIIPRNQAVKTTHPLSITSLSNRLSIHIPTTEHPGKRLRVSMFSVNGKTVYTAETRMAGGKVDVPIDRLSWGMHLIKITSGKDFEYTGSLAITH
jgi:hypothetical protein